MGFSRAKASGPKADRGCENFAIAFSPLPNAPIALAGTKRDTTELGSLASTRLELGELAIRFGLTIQPFARLTWWIS